MPPVKPTTADIGKTEPEPRAGAASSVHVVTTPPATIVFDNDSAKTCRTPCDFDLAAGRHSLAANAEGYRQRLMIFYLPKEKELVFTLDRAMGELAVTTNPPGASVSIDGQATGKTTPATFSLAPGKHKLILVKEGFQRIEDEVEVRDGATRQVNYDWRAQ